MFTSPVFTSRMFSPSVAKNSVAKNSVAKNSVAKTSFISPAFKTSYTPLRNYSVFRNGSHNGNRNVTHNLAKSSTKMVPPIYKMPSFVNYIGMVNRYRNFTVKTLEDSGNKDSGDKEESRQRNPITELWKRLIARAAKLQSFIKTSISSINTKEAAGSFLEKGRIISGVTSGCFLTYLCLEESIPLGYPKFDQIFMATLMFGIGFLGGIVVFFTLPISVPISAYIYAVSEYKCYQKEKIRKSNQNKLN
jgi:hypothetical protein